MFHSSSSLLWSPRLCLCVLSKSFLSCFSASVLSLLCVCVAGPLSRRWTAGLTSSGGLRGVKPSPSLRGDLTAGGLVLFPFFHPSLSQSICLHVFVINVCSSVYPPVKTWPVRLEKPSLLLLSLSLCFLFPVEQRRAFYFFCCCLPNCCSPLTLIAACCGVHQLLTLLLPYRVLLSITSNVW